MLIFLERKKRRVRIFLISHLCASASSHDVWNVIITERCSATGLAWRKPSSRKRRKGRQGRAGQRRTGRDGIDGWAGGLRVTSRAAHHKGAIFLLCFASAAVSWPRSKKLEWRETPSFPHNIYIHIYINKDSWI